MATGYGVEISCTNQLVTGRLVSGRALVLEAWYRRLTTPRGSIARVRLPDDEDLAYGFDVVGFVGAVGYQRAQATIAGMAVNELSKDDRAHNIKATATFVENGDGTQNLLLEISGTLVDSDEDLSLTLSVSDVSVSIINAQ